ncbi:MAG TPA: glycosyltransferase [Terriglobales bacterium]
MSNRAKILQIGNYPPPMCGWAIQTKLVTDELRRRGHICDVLKINEGRQVKDPSYVDVQNGRDYLVKVLQFAFRGYRLNVHVNGMSKKGYILALIAVLAGRLVFHPALVTFHGGLSQDYFPRPDSPRLRFAFWLLFALAGGIACDSAEIKQAIVGYRIRPDKVSSIATFSSQYLSFTPAKLSPEIEQFLAQRDPVFFSYVSFRTEYRLEVLREGMAKFREGYPRAGFVWLGFPEKEMPAARKFVEDWPEDERASLLLLGNLTHDEFLTLMSRSYACLRTPACDGVAASVLESLTLGVPVVASENGRRPTGVITYDEMSSDDMVAKLRYLAENYEQVKAKTRLTDAEDNVGLMANWLASEKLTSAQQEVVRVG